MVDETTSGALRAIGGHPAFGSSWSGRELTFSLAIHGLRKLLRRSGNEQAAAPQSAAADA